MAMTTAQRRARLIELRGARTQEEIADAIGVTGTAVYAWEKKGHVSRKHAEAYDAALGAGGEVLNMLGYADTSGVTVTTIDKKLDRILAELEKLTDNLRGREVGDGTPSEMPRPVLKGRRG